jgi:DNA-directed RNA polymerase specialized sigma24 family protein
MPDNAPNQFPDTEWTMVLAAGSNGSMARSALERLCRKYWAPLFGFARRSGLSHEAAEDVVQTYLLTVIERGSLVGLERGGARFRSWLLGGMEFAITNARRHDNAEKRGGGKPIFSLDESLAELPVFAGLTAAEAYDRQWAQTVMMAAVSRLRKEQLMSGKEVLYSLLEPIVTGQAKTSYSLLAEKLETQEKNVALMVHRLRIRLREILRAEISHTVASAEDLEDEMQYLLKVASR